jgi:hypothetical protein
MTDDEKRHQKAELLLQYQEAEENLAHLREKAGVLSKLVDEVAMWMSRAHIPVRANDQDDRRRDGNIRKNPAKYREAMNFDAALSLMDEIAEVCQQLNDLSERKKALGLK